MLIAPKSSDVLILDAALGDPTDPRASTGRPLIVRVVYIVANAPRCCGGRPAGYVQTSKVALGLSTCDAHAVDATFVTGILPAQDIFETRPSTLTNEAAREARASTQRACGDLQRRPTHAEWRSVAAEGAIKPRMRGSHRDRQHACPNSGTP
ncbi:hypothetical protein PsYK624_165900 [Phanerochaete sordida]|uniref:Uncharacterized protein n=1 Tax=Phanerochaete sordida TaxID=48140 RepID=A0A9P3GWQ0_9APHY|nr:hypothetical protein PsYK624_165900 [Phanerochaete sordida]